jgi:hypothetical protein
MERESRISDATRDPGLRTPSHLRLLAAVNRRCAGDFDYNSVRRHDMRTHRQIDNARRHSARALTFRFSLIEEQRDLAVVVLNQSYAV